MILQSKYTQDENGVKFAPITTPNAVRWPDGSNLNDKLSGSAYVPTLNAAPTSSTTTYTKDGQTVDFEIGQFARVANQDNPTGYDMWQLYDLVTENDVTTAVWRSTDAVIGDINTILDNINGEVV